ncbi:unnamed protein product, partial [Cylicostephanus goldi]
VFNILCVCAEPFTVEPEALEFLAKHSFDFNRLIDSGVRYYPSTVAKACPLRSLFTEILSTGTPLILHNGLVDLAFIFHHFYSPIPDSQGDNVREALVSRWHIKIAFDDTTSMMGPLRDACERVDCQLPPGFPKHLIPYDLKGKVCEQFSVVGWGLQQCDLLQNHGFCRKQRQGQCDLLHDVDYAIDLENEKLEKNRKKRKRRYDYLKPDSILEKERLEEEEKESRKGKVSVEEVKKNKPRIAITGCHRAGVDAFMTGYAALFQSRLSICRDGKLDEQTERTCVLLRYDYLKPDSILEKERLEEEEKESRKGKVSVEEVKKNKPRIAITGCHRAGVDAFMTGYAALFQSRLSICRDGKLDEQHLNRIPLSGKAEPFVIQRTQFAGSCEKHENRFASIKSARLKSALQKEAANT